MSLVLLLAAGYKLVTVIQLSGLGCSNVEEDNEDFHPRVGEYP
jgi:hypothetical protein